MLKQLRRAYVEQMNSYVLSMTFFADMKRNEKVAGAHVFQSLLCISLACQTREVTNFSSNSLAPNSLASFSLQTNTEYSEFSHK